MEILHPATSDRATILRRRLEFEQDATIDRPNIRAALRYCLNSTDPDERLTGIYTFFDLFAYTYNPRLKPFHFPFILYPFQRDYVKSFDSCYINQEDFLTEKSREVGVTWIYAAWSVAMFLFAESFNAHIIGKKEEDLDNKLIDTVFPKMKYLIKRLPAWLLPDGFSLQKNYQHLIINRPDSENGITGESANPEAGISRRYSIIWLDEFPINPCAKAIWNGTADTTGCRAPVGTPRGKGNMFAELRFGGQIKVFTLHWSQHPIKAEGLTKDRDGKYTSPWYEKEKKRRTAENVASELDISYSGSATGIIYREFSRIACLSDTDYDPSLPLYTAWDFGISDPTIIEWIQTVGREVRIVDAMEFTDRPIDFYAPFVLGHVPPKDADGRPWRWEYTEAQARMIERHGKWKQADRHYGDDDCKKTESMTGSSVYLRLIKYGINIHAFRVSMTDRVDSAKRVIKDRFFINRRLAWLADCFENYRWGANGKPIHDEYCHAPAAFEYFTSQHNQSVRAVTHAAQHAGSEVIDRDLGY